MRQLPFCDCAETRAPHHTLSECPWTRPDGGVETLHELGQGIIYSGCWIKSMTVFDFMHTNKYIVPSAYRESLGQ